MTRDDAYYAMLAGNKITHRYFSKDEFYQIKEGKIIAEDGVNHTTVFWSESDNNFREKGWEIFTTKTTTP